MGVKRLKASYIFISHKLLPDCAKLRTFQEKQLIFVVHLFLNYGELQPFEIRCWDPWNELMVQVNVCNFKEYRMFWEKCQSSCAYFSRCPLVIVLWTIEKIIHTVMCCELQVTQIVVATKIAMIAQLYCPENYANGKEKYSNRII